MVTEAPGAMTQRKYAAALVPCGTGETAPVSPFTMYRWKASLTCGTLLGVPLRLSRLLSFPVNSHFGLLRRDGQSAMNR